eukprot:TRINITY_DN19918_c0_g1_i1.p1 TRINITY_DN19918_c0_g1~~TRINITY_DN19918_c0_g1_i1.p1  ORF type:complete len:463 (+),score=98.85 TRINITY_DN19918_c0_g1_i1:65-1453(+)
MAGEVLLAASTDDQGIFATDLHSGALLNTFEDSSAHPGAFGLVGNSNYLFAVQEKRALWNVWAWGEKKPCYRASLPERTTAMVFTRDGTLCFAGAATGSIYVWQAGTGSLLRCWPAHFREVTQLLISQDECFLFSASADSTVHAYNLADIFTNATPKPTRSFSGHSLAVTSMALLPGSGMQQSVVTGSLDRSVRVWDVAVGRSASVHTLSAPVRCLSASPLGSEVLCACGDGELRSVALGSALREETARYSGHTGAVVSCCFNADASRAASCSEVDRVRVWETRMRQCISQVHASRNVQIGAVRIIRRPADPLGLPAFQPFQRLLTAPEEAPPVPLCLGAGRIDAVQEELRSHASNADFVKNVVWSEAGDFDALSRNKEADDRLAVAEAERAEWARAAASLYEELELCGKTPRFPLGNGGDGASAEAGPPAAAGEAAAAPDGAAAAEAEVGSTASGRKKRRK